MDPRPLSVAVLLFGVLVYVAAVAGLLFAEPTPPADVGALSLLVTCLLFGGYGFFLVNRTKVPT
ncbi:MAG: hypothetical protein QOJ26_194 [Thermoplasmata archaeon]|jgi:hypothetical protein|nr:hypothetical protein [Thermoplasmata archaeon]MEA3165350.1 hypothetical protein [Thermoplasmata archaeon]